VGDPTVAGAHNIEDPVVPNGLELFDARDLGPARRSEDGIDDVAAVFAGELLSCRLRCEQSDDLGRLGILMSVRRNSRGSAAP
jgi:hypothetical protein